MNTRLMPVHDALNQHGLHPAPCMPRILVRMAAYFLPGVLEERVARPAPATPSRVNRACVNRV